MQLFEAEPPALFDLEQIEQREDIRVGIAVEDFAQDLLGSADCIEPIMNDGDTHYSPHFPG